jgi:hypothetical protein
MLISMISTAALVEWRPANGFERKAGMEDLDGDALGL